MLIPRSYGVGTKAPHGGDGGGPHRVDALFRLAAARTGLPSPAGRVTGLPGQHA
ncbi:hypothetical protein [Streptomyces sp. NPDC003401]